MLNIRGRWIGIGVLAIVAATPSGRSAGRRFFASLRLAKPVPVATAAPAPTGSSANRQFQDAVSGMLSSAVRVTLDEPDGATPSTDSASKLAGFSVLLPRGRSDQPVLTVLGGRVVQMAIDRDALRTTLRQAGQPKAQVPESLQGALVVIRTPRAVRAQYGNCPAPAANTLQAQIQGTPPPSTDNGSCLVLTQSMQAGADLPAGLEIDRLVGIALELAGMSPNQTRAFQSTFDWRSSLVLSLPRQMRAYEMATVQGAPAMLVNTAGRRGPTYALVWSKGGMTYLLTGYGNPGDAVHLANSVS